jgi:hypothetical protein
MDFNTSYPTVGIFNDSFFLRISNHEKHPLFK